LGKPATNSQLNCNIVILNGLAQVVITMVVQFMYLLTTIIQKFSFMKPINDRVVVKPAPAEEKTKGGIIIPDTAKEKPQRGEVIAVGPGKDGNLMTVQVGDIVLYGKYSGQELHYNGEDYLIMREDDILVVL
jgi:chaperonin GroES